MPNDLLELNQKVDKLNDNVVDLMTNMKYCLQELKGVTLAQTFIGTTYAGLEVEHRHTRESVDMAHVKIRDLEKDAERRYAAEQIHDAVEKVKNVRGNPILVDFFSKVATQPLFWLPAMAIIILLLSIIAGTIGVNVPWQDIFGHGYHK